MYPARHLFDKLQSVLILECGCSGYCWRTPSAPEARGTLAGGGAKRNHRKRHNRATRPERAPDPGCFCREFWSVAPIILPNGTPLNRLQDVGCDSLARWLILTAWHAAVCQMARSPGREIASLSLPAVSQAIPLANPPLTPKTVISCCRCKNKHMPNTFGSLINVT